MEYSTGRRGVNILNRAYNVSKVLFSSLLDNADNYRRVLAGKPAVFFGPFVGEFGWEVLFWQGWVRKVCKEDFVGWRRIACSYEGHDNFYPYCEFESHVIDFDSLGMSRRNYISDYWKLADSKDNAVDVAVSGEGFVNYAEQNLRIFREKYNKNVKFIIPWKRNTYKGLVFGSDIHKDRKYRISFQNQCFDKLAPTEHYKDLFNEMFPKSEKRIVVFPRSRATRRPDKNWSKENYDRLIELLKNEYSDHQIFIAGDGIGSYYGDRCPEGCLSLIHVEKKVRMGLQLAALNNARFAVGGMSGAILFSCMAKCPTLTWGIPEQHDRYHRENALKTKLEYIPYIQVKPEVIIKKLRELSY